MAGDRFRIINFRPKQIAPEEHWKHTTRNHIYSASAYYRFTPGHTLQATYCRRIFNPEFGDFVTAGDTEGSWQPVYTADIGNSMANVVELKHTYSRPAFVLSTSVKNIHQHLFSAIHDNTLGIGSTAFWHKGILRLTAGVNYFWQRSETPSEEAQQRSAEYNHFAVFKLAPQLTMSDGWRFTGNLIWCTRRRSDPYTPANLYAEVGVYKNLGKHWTLEAASTIWRVSTSAIALPPSAARIIFNLSFNNLFLNQKQDFCSFLIFLSERRKILKRKEQYI